MSVSNKKKTLPSARVQQLIKTIYDDCVAEDTAVRERQIRNWRRLKLLWEGYQRIWYNEVAHDWRIFDTISDNDNDQSYYDKQINIFKAYLESIIAVLSVVVPPLKCYPDDADNSLDTETAKAGDKICSLIYKHNRVPLLWLHMLFIFVTEGMVAIYNYPKEDESYGTYTENEEEDVEETQQQETCPECGYLFSSNPIQQAQEEQKEDQQENQYDPDDKDADLDYEIKYNDNLELCPACNQQVYTQLQNKKLIVTRIVGSNEYAKSRICLEAYGGLYIKVGNYAHCQEEVPYLIKGTEKDYSIELETYKHLNDDDDFLRSVAAKETAGAYDQYDQWGRLNPQYWGEYPVNVVTENTIWIRPAKYNILAEKEDIDLLRRKFPDGIKAVFVNNCLGEACNESLDDCWTLMKNPLSDYLHFEPLGSTLTSVQEITNDLVSLTLQTIEHGVGQTIADPAVFDFKAYAQTEVLPGSILPSKTLGNKQLRDSIFEFRTATLSGEVMPFSSQIQTFGQQVSGALPSLFGGQLENNNTASGYSMSRAQALQRQQNTWKMFTMTWTDVFSKVVPMFIQNLQEDERTVELDKKTNRFFNTYIRIAELQGKIGRIELDANEQLPQTWSQIKDTINALLANPNPVIAQILGDPENLPIIHEALGLPEMYVPGEDDVDYYVSNIELLIQSAPINGGPSIQVDPAIDNINIGFKVCRDWLISDRGRQCKIDNSDGYQNVLLYAYNFHQVQQAQATPPPLPPKGKPSQPIVPQPVAQEAPIMGEGNVPTVQ